MSTRQLRKRIKLITAVGVGALLSILGAANALASNGPGPWP